jgi:hypothetical protein
MMLNIIVDAIVASWHTGFTGNRADLKRVN